MFHERGESADCGRQRSSVYRPTSDQFSREELTVTVRAQQQPMAALSQPPFLPSRQLCRQSSILAHFPRKPPEPPSSPPPSLSPLFHPRSPAAVSQNTASRASPSDQRTNRQQPRTNHPSRLHPSRIGPHRLRAHPVRKHPYSVRPLPSRTIESRLALPAPHAVPAIPPFRPRPASPPPHKPRAGACPFALQRSAPPAPGKQQKQKYRCDVHPAEEPTGCLAHTPARASRCAQKSLRSVSGVPCGPGRKRCPAGVANFPLRS